MVKPVNAPLTDSEKRQLEAFRLKRNLEKQLVEMCFPNTCVSVHGETITVEQLVSASSFSLNIHSDKLASYLTNQNEIIVYNKSVLPQAKEFKERYNNHSVLKGEITINKSYGLFSRIFGKKR